MRTKHTSRRAVAVVGGAAFITMGLIAGCGTSGNQAPSTTPTTTTTTTESAPSSTTEPTVSPTEKGLSPTGGNSFAPPVLAPPAPTEPPGIHRHKN
jgi:hypothetical protein